MRVLAVDPGVTTGIAVRRESTVLGTQTDVYPFEALDNLLGRYDWDEVLCEKGPVLAAQHRETIEHVERIVTKHAPDVIWIRPSEWKGTPPTRGELAASTPHERDAANLIRFHEWRTRRTHGKDAGKSDTA